MLSATPPPHEAPGRLPGNARSIDANDPLSIVRSALGAEEQVIRVSDSDTRETYDVTLSRTMPYASPRVTPKYDDNAPAPVMLTPPPTRRRRLRWMRSLDDARTAASPTPPTAVPPSATLASSSAQSSPSPAGSTSTPMSYPYTPLPPLANVQRMLGPRRTHQAPAPPLLVPRETGGSSSELTFDEEMAENADALRRSWRVKEHRSKMPLALKGHLIGEDHVNYVLMYHMLTGIRIAVSRNEARPRTQLTPADFTAKYKFTFDIIGNELRPSSNYDFKFKDYAPGVFCELRRHFGLDAGDYLLSLAAKYILTELGSPGKSGSFFYFSHDYRFIIKTIRSDEHRLFMRFLPAYYEHVRGNPHTLLSQFYGLHRVKLPGRRKIHFVIMNNLFPSHRDVHEVYDLKGSTVSREQLSAKPSAVLKDMNWLQRDRYVELGPQKRAQFERQLRADVSLLQRLQLMDYSLLIGLHDLSYGPSTSPINKSTPMLRRPSILVSPVDDKEADASSTQLQFSRNHPHQTSLQDMQGKRAEQQRSLFYQDEGGFRATDEHDQPLGLVYYFGIIDLFTRFDARKRSEHIWKALWHDRHAISPVPPVEYGERFIRFLLRKKPSST